ncbi:MAG: hypothetical protein DBX53_07560 [Clostridiales bacterium]|nr:MAG: hypothetical protein DBX53_07560 [Clostridiales bacterium]
MPDTKEKHEKRSKIIPHGEMDKRRAAQKRKRRRLLGLIAAVIAAVLLIVFFAKGGYEKILDFLGIERNIAVTPTITEVACELKGEPVIAGVGGTIIIYDEQGVTGYGSDGKWKWNEACTLENPVVSYCGGSVVYTDSGGTAAYAFGPEGILWRYGSEKKLMAVFGGASGQICMIHEENEYLSAATIFEYDEKSSELRELFTRKFGSHYMLAGAVSPDGRQLALSGAYSKGGDAAGIVSFLRMSDGEVFTSDAEDEIYVKMFYADDGRLFAANSDSVRVLYHSLTASSEEDSDQEIWNRENGRELLADAVLVNGKYLVAALNSENSGKTVVKGYDTAGKERLNFEISGNIIGMHTAGDAVLLYTDRYIYMYNEKGLLIGTQEAGFTIKKAVCTDSRHAAVYGDGRVLSVSFQ